MTEYTNSQIKTLILERVHDKRHRLILYNRYVNGETFERLAEDYGLSSKQISRIIHKYDHALFHDLPG
ncbi:MAG: hypothetical protein IK099_06860 [Clostridia bacterium]|nr:hypothetical protein [Clostridia bacterium]